MRAFTEVCEMPLMLMILVRKTDPPRKCTQMLSLTKMDMMQNENERFSQRSMKILDYFGPVAPEVIAAQPQSLYIH